MEKRLSFADMLKGVAILGVVFYHLIAPGAFKTLWTHTGDALMIMFFFISGYFHKSGKRPFGEDVKRRCKAMMVPFFKYSLLFWAIGTIQQLIAKTETFLDAVCCLRNFYAGCIWNRVIQNWFSWDYHSLGKRYPFLADFWFLIAMMLASILFYLIVDRLIKSRFRTALGFLGLLFTTALLCLLHVDLPYNIHMVPFWTAFMLLGAFAGSRSLFENPPIPMKARWISSVVCLAGGIALSLIKDPLTNLFRGSFQGDPLDDISMCIVTALLLIWGLGEFFVLIEQAGVRTKELSWVGSHSMVFYIYHMFFAWIFCVITGFSTSYKEPISAGTVWMSILLTAFSLTFCFLRIVLGEYLAERKAAAAATAPVK